VNLMDKNTNSLKQLNQYLGLLSKIKMENDKKNEIREVRLEEITKEDASVPPPPPPPAAPRSK
jgi:hypothetical protein